ncbi:MAG: hypothetical protein K2X25_16635 [Caulobacteraceae bacterium]|nr:hypothetical protein [Caulobacteraceae bacterium]
MAITHRIDDQRRQVWIRADGATTGAHVSGFIVELAESRSELMDYDFVHDLREASGDVNNNDVDRVATSFSARPSSPSHTVFITRDPSFGLWARSMDFQFPNRKHHVVQTPAEAEALLRRLRSEVSPARSPT